MVPPEAGGQPRQVRRPQGSGLDALGALDLGVGQVRLELHEEAVGASPAIHLERAQGQAGLLLHSQEQIVGLVGQGFRHRSDEVLPGDAPGQPHHGAPGVGLPVGSSQPDKGGDHIDASRVLQLRAD